MRTTNLNKLTKAELNEWTEIKWLSLDISNNLLNFKNRLTKNLENPFSEYWVRSMNILDMKDTTPDEELDMKVWQMFWYSLNKMWEMVKNDRGDSQIKHMLAPFWITIVDDYNYKQKLNA
jgi:hypothetical protein